MGNHRDRILIVESDPVISDLIGRQALQSLGYQVKIVADSTAAIPQAVQFQPDTIIADLKLPGLSGKDLMVALTSQGIHAPVIIIAHKGMDADIIQALRLGAADYLVWPVRDAEVVAVIERVLKQGREWREREHLARQLLQTNHELQNRVRELTAVFSIGKSVTSSLDQRVIYERIIDGAVRVSNADVGWFLLRDENSKGYILAAHRQLPPGLGTRLGQVWDDGISMLVAASGEPLSMYGEPLKRFKISTLGQSILIVPIKIQKQTFGLLTMVRRVPQPFSLSEQNLLEAAADYASIALVNARQFKLLEDRQRQSQEAAQAAQAAEKLKTQSIDSLVRQLRPEVEAARGHVGTLVQGKKGKLPPEQQQILLAVQEKIALLSRLVGAGTAPLTPSASLALGEVNLNDLSRQSLARFHRTAQQNGLILVSELASPPVIAWGDALQLTQVLDGLLSNAIKFSRPGGQVTMRTDYAIEGLPHVVVRDAGIGIAAKSLAHLFDADACKQDPIAGLTMKSSAGLRSIKEIITACGGKIWVESKPGQGSAFHFTLPLPPEHA